MSLRVKVRDAAISSQSCSDELLSKSGERSKLVNKVYGIAKKSLVSRKAVSMIIALLVFYTVLGFRTNPKLNSLKRPTIKLYVYNLPYKFTYGIIEHYHGSNKSLEYPTHQHMGEWFIFQHLMSNSCESHVMRVYDPKVAELFYVPFLSSLSVMVRSEEYDDEKTQVDLMEWLERQEFWRRNYARDHVIVASHPNAYKHVIHNLNNCTFILGQPRPPYPVINHVVAPYVPLVPSYTTPHNNRNTLIFSIKSAYENTHTSKFCLNPPGGDYNWLSDSIVSLCVPVVVGNQCDHLELPFEDIIDYTQIALFVSTQNALKPGFLVSLLTSIPESQLIQYQKRLRLVKPYFDFHIETLNQIWRQVTNKLPFIKLMINHQRRLVNHNYFLKPVCSCSNQTIHITNFI